MKIKPEEAYPQQRIDEIKNILAQLLSARQAYDAAIARADRDFGREAFAEAKSGYTEAQQAKPDEAYPAEQIAKIDSIVEARARLAAEAEAAEQARLAALQAEKESQYASAVSRGDSLFTLTDYDNSRSAYELALKIKPEEAYPQQRIGIKNILAQLLSKEMPLPAPTIEDFRKSTKDEAYPAQTNPLLNAARKAYAQFPSLPIMTTPEVPMSALKIKPEISMH